MTSAADSLRPGSVDEYIDSFDPEVQDFLRRLRSLSRAAAPNAEEGLKWGTPAYSLGSILFIFSAHKHHANFVFTPSTKEAFASRLEGFETGKGSVKLFYDREIPSDLLRDMIAYRIHEFEVDGIKWM